MANNLFYTVFRGPLLLELFPPGQPRLELPLAGFQAEFAINTIPTAVVSLAVGRSSENIRRQVEPWQTFDWGREAIPARVTAHLSGHHTSQLRWPNQPFVLFEGDMVGLRPSRLYDQVALQGVIRHWVGRLNLTSLFSSSGFLGNPFALNAKLMIHTASESFKATTQFDPKTAAKHITKWKSLDQTTDVWRFLSDVYEKLLTYEPAWLDLDKCAMWNQPSPDVIAALNRINPPSSRQQLKVNKVVAQLGVLQSVSEFLATAMFASGDGSVWSNLVEILAPSLGMVVCPGIRRVMVASDLPNVRINGTHKFQPWTTISKELIGTAIVYRDTPPVRAVSVYTTRTMETTAESGASEVVTHGCFSLHSRLSPSNPPPGVVVFVQQPPWLEGLGFRLSDPTQNKPAKSATTQQPPAQGNPQVSTEGLRTVLERYAQLVFARLKLRGESVECTLPFRLDIGPGSVVAIRPTDRDIAVYPHLLNWNTLYGTVTSVLIRVDAEKKMAGTILTVDYLRTASENESSPITMDEHPLFDADSLLNASSPDKRLGMPLLDEQP